MTPEQIYDLLELCLGPKSKNRSKKNAPKPPQAEMLSKPEKYQIYTREKLKKNPGQTTGGKQPESPKNKNKSSKKAPKGSANSKKSTKFEEEPSRQSKEDQYVQYKPDSAIIRTRDEDYDPDIDADTQTLFFQRVPIAPEEKTKNSIPFSSPSKVTLPPFNRPKTRSKSKSSLDPERSKSPLPGDKKYSRYLYHPHGYFTEKGLNAKATNIEKFSFAPRVQKQSKTGFPIQQGILSKASRQNIDTDCARGHTQVIDGPWYPGGSKMDTHNSRLKFGNSSSKSDLFSPNSPFKGSVERLRNSSKDKAELSGKSNSKIISPLYMTTHLNSVKAKNRRNSNAEADMKSIKVATKNFNPN